MTDSVKCPSCGKDSKLTTAGKFRQHGPKDEPCEMSGLFVPNDLLKAAVMEGLKNPLPPPRPPAAAGPASSTSESRRPDGSENPPRTDPAPHADAPADSSEETPVATGEKDAAEIPGSSEYAENLAARQLDAYKGVAAENGRPYFREETGFTACDFTCEPGMQQCRDCESRTAVVKYEQPDPLPAEAPTEYDQPAKLNRAVTAMRPMNEFELQVCAMLREMFFQYTNRSRRSQQTTLGPSQIGTPCDRKLVMHFLQAPKVNPGGDNWASFVGTQIHNGLEGMLKWADAGRGRFAVEQRLSFPSELVPRGTADMIDRTLFMIGDHKAQGQWAADKLRTSGPTPLYRVQLHVYGMGARQRGEKIERVSLISWPRDKSNLDDLYVFSEPYNPQIARDALKRVEDLKAWTDVQRAEGKTPPEIAAGAAIADDCSFCPYHMSGAKDLTNGGCNGRR